MSGAWVRPARLTDVAAVAETQVRAWRAGYAGVVPEAVLTEMTGDAALSLWRARWSAAVTAPPTPRHRLLVAVDAEAGGSANGTAGADEQAAGPGPSHGNIDETVAGFAAIAPADDPDLAAETTGELLTLLVEPARQRHGHGSRLLTAAVDLLREDGCATAVSWVFEADKVTEEFLSGTGWAPDGARRSLDMGEPVPMLRMHTALGDPPRPPAQSTP